MELCVYCNTNPKGNSEHVFPHSLGGQKVFMECVCDKCNNKFSTFERELFQKSLIGLMRSYAGLSGYSKNKRHPAPLKYPEIFFHDKKDKVVYEIGLYHGFKPFFRPQFIEIKSKFYSEGPSKEGLIDLVNAYNKWRQNSLVLVTKLPPKKGDNYKIASFEEQPEKYTFTESDVKKVKNAVIFYPLMRDNNKMKPDFTPRLFLDDGGKLILRARTKSEGVKFMNELLNYTKSPAPFGSYNQHKPEKPLIRVTMKFDMVKMQRALVKIGLNVLMHHYPKTQHDHLLDEAKSFVMNETPFGKSIDPKMQYLDINENLHYVLLYQLKEGLLVRSSLFGGHFIYSFLIKDLNIHSRHSMFTGFEVDFTSRRQRFLNMDDFLINRLSDMGWLTNDGKNL